MNPRRGEKLPSIVTSFFPVESAIVCESQRKPVVERQVVGQSPLVLREGAEGARLGGRVSPGATNRGSSPVRPPAAADPDELLGLAARRGRRFAPLHGDAGSIPVVQRLVEVRRLEFDSEFRRVLAERSLERRSQEQSRAARRRR